MKTIIILVVSFTTLLFFSCNSKEKAEKNRLFAEKISSARTKTFKLEKYTKCILYIQMIHLTKEAANLYEKAQNLTNESIKLSQEVTSVLENKVIPLTEKSIKLKKDGKDDKSYKLYEEARLLFDCANQLSNESKNKTNESKKLEKKADLKIKLVEQKKLVADLIVL